MKNIEWIGFCHEKDKEKGFNCGNLWHESAICWIWMNGNDFNLFMKYEKFFFMNQNAFLPWEIC